MTRARPSAPSPAPLRRPLLARLRAIGRSEDGAVTIPTLFWLPMFVVIMVSSVELFVLGFKQTMLERGVDQTTRLLRLGVLGAPTADALKRSICTNIAFLPGCMDDLFVEVRSINKLTWATTDADPGMRCIDRDPDVEQTATVQLGASNQMMMLRACLKIRPIATGGVKPGEDPNETAHYWQVNPLGAYLIKDAYGEASLGVTTFFINEPRLKSASAP